MEADSVACHVDIFLARFLSHIVLPYNFLSRLGTGRVVTAVGAVSMTRRSMSIFRPLAMKPYQLPKTQQVREACVS